MGTATATRAGGVVPRNDSPSGASDAAKRDTGLQTVSAKEGSITWCEACTGFGQRKEPVPETMPGRICEGELSKKLRGAANVVHRVFQLAVVRVDVDLVPLALCSGACLQHHDFIQL
ncbi:unnamed protein product [Ectocarpus sp. 6 AP-2014]